MDNKEFFRQAGKIHDMHIREEESADVEIAKKRIDKYFKREINLSWKSIIYEINKLPELERNKCFTKLVDEQVKYNSTLAIMKERKDSIEAITQWSILIFIRERRKAIKNNYVKIMENQIKNYERTQK